MALLPEGKSWGVCLVQLCAQYRLGSVTESLQLVSKDKRSWFSQGERSTVQLPLDYMFALRK